MSSTMKIMEWPQGTARVLCDPEKMLARLVAVTPNGRQNNTDIAYALIVLLCNKLKEEGYLSLEAEAAFSKNPEHFAFLLEAGFLPTETEYPVYTLHGADFEALLIAEEQAKEEEKPSLECAPKEDIKYLQDLSSLERKKLYALLQKSYLSFDPEGLDGIEESCSAVYVPDGEPKAVILVRETTVGVELVWMESDPKTRFNAIGVLWAAIQGVSKILKGDEIITICTASTQSQKLIKEVKQIHPNLSMDMVRYTILSKPIAEENAAYHAKPWKGNLNLLPRYYGCREVLDSLYLENELILAGEDEPALFLYPEEDIILAWYCLAVDSENGKYISTFQTCLTYPPEKKKEAEDLAEARINTGFSVRRELKPDNNKLILSAAVPESERISEDEVISFVIQRIVYEYRTLKAALSGQQ